MRLLTRFLGRASKDAFEARLTAYPPYAPPHLGPPRTLDLPAMRANLAHHLDTIDERIDTLRTFLREDGVTTYLDRAADQAEPGLDALDDWAVQRGLNISSPKLSYDAIRHGGEMHGSLALCWDIGSYLGEVLCDAFPTLEWGVDETIASADEDDAYGRPVLLNRKPPYAAQLPCVVDEHAAVLMHIDQASASVRRHGVPYHTTLTRGTRRYLATCGPANGT